MSKILHRYRRGTGTGGWTRCRGRAGEGMLRGDVGEVASKLIFRP